MQLRHMFQVTATHPALPAFNEKVEVSVSPQYCADSLFYVHHRELGCGKDYATPQAAIRGIMESHGYRNIVAIETAI